MSNNYLNNVVDGGGGNYHVVANGKSRNRRFKKQTFHKMSYDSVGIQNKLG